MEYEKNIKKGRKKLFDVIFNNFYYILINNIFFNLKIILCKKDLFIHLVEVIS